MSCGNESIATPREGNESKTETSSSTTVSSSEIDFIKEEYKLVSGSLIVIEDRILKVFAGTVAVNITLLSAIFSYVFKSAHPYYVEEAYTVLLPMFLLVPSFLLILSLRMDLARGAAYILVFIEERNLGPSWGTRLISFREGPSSDSLDTVPYTYWILAAASCCSFVYIIRQTTGAEIYHYWTFIIAAAVFVPITKQWNRARDHFAECAERWRTIRDSGGEPGMPISLTPCSAKFSQTSV